MKKGIFIVCLIVIIIIGVLFVLTGCDKSENINENQKSSTNSKLDKEEIVNKLHFNYSGSATIKDSTNGKRVENENYTIIVSHQEGKTVAELENARKFTLISTESINKIEWKKYSYNDEQVSSIVYMYEKDNGTYVVTITHDAGLNINLENEIKEFMNNIRFE